MRYLLAILLPPVAVLLCGKPFQALLNLLLCVLLLWVGGAVHAILVVNDYYADRRVRQVVEAIRQAGMARA